MQPLMVEPLRNTSHLVHRVQVSAIVPIGKLGHIPVVQMLLTHMVEGPACQLLPSSP